jgi:putative ABC transport system permease protein
MTLLGFMRKNLFRKKLRLTLTTIAIVIAFLIFGVLLTVQGALQRGTRMPEADRLMTMNKVNFTQPLPVAYAARIRGMEGVKEVSFSSWFGAYYQEPRNVFAAFAVDPETYLAINTEIVLSPAERAAFLQDRIGIAVGEKLAKRFGWKLGDHIPISSNIFRQKDGSSVWEFNVVGIYGSNAPAFSTDGAVLHYDYFNESRGPGMGRDYVNFIYVQTRDPKLNDRIIAQIDGTFANSDLETETKTTQAFAAAMSAQFGDIGFIVSSVVGAAFVTILLIVGNTMALAVRERRAEIAVLKTIGFPSARIFRLVLGESLLLSLLGGLLGLGLAWFATGIIGKAIPQFPALSMTPLIVALGLGLMVGLGLVTGLLPALRAMRASVTTALGRA